MVHFGVKLDGPFLSFNHILELKSNSRILFFSFDPAILTWSILKKVDVGSFFSNVHGGPFTFFAPEFV